MTKFIHEIRAVKNKKELNNIIKAQRISETVLNEALLKLRIGVSETEIDKEIKRLFIKHKAPILSFPPIVSFGKNTFNIHHKPSKNKLKKGDIVMFDIGCTVNHYCSDMTRTFFFGNPTKKQIGIYKKVLNAQNKSIEKIQNGERRAGVIDNLARKLLGKNFVHGLGHGVGTVIHEWPSLKPKSDDIIPNGCVITIEPGLYIKNFGGIRVEDMVLVTKNGYINLTKFPKELDDIILDC